MAQERIELKTRWSTPEATARTFGLSKTEARRIADDVEHFLRRYRPRLKVRKGRLVVVRKRGRPERPAR